MPVQTGAIHIYHKSQLDGMVDDDHPDDPNEWVVFLSDWKNRLASSWIWCKTGADAEEIAAKAHEEVPDWAY